MTDDRPSPPWLHLLDHIWLCWREEQILKGRDPDPHIEKKLIEMERWPPNNRADYATKDELRRSEHRVLMTLAALVVGIIVGVAVAANLIV